MNKSDEVTASGSEVNNLLKIAEDALSRILTFARGSMSDIHFASLFLSTGRQLEPHQCNHLFPLLLSAHASSKSLIINLEDHSNNVPLSISVQDLYYSAVAAGSLTVAASALPLLDVKKFTHKQCMLLLHHSISTILSLSTVGGNQCISCIREECLFFRQLYLYGLKLEDSANMFEFEEDSCTSDEDSSTSDNSNLSEDDSINSENSCDTSSYSKSFPISQDDECSPAQTKPSGSPSRVLRLASTLFSPIKVFNKMKEEKKSEIAISEAASSFIFSGYCDDIYEIEGTPCVGAESADMVESTVFREESRLELDTATDEYDSETRSSLTLEDNTIGIAETIGFALVSSMFFPSTMESSSSRLNKVAMLCLLLQSDEQSFTSVNTGLSNLIKKVTEDSFQNSVESISQLEVCHNDSGYLNDSCALSSVKSVINSLLLLCVDQWDYDLSSTVLQTIISLLTQDSSGKLSKITPLLALIALSAGHACAKVEILFGSDSEGMSPLEKLYRQCVEEL